MGFTLLYSKFFSWKIFLLNVILSGVESINIYFDNVLVKVEYLSTILK